MWHALLQKPISMISAFQQCRQNMVLTQKIAPKTEAAVSSTTSNNKNVRRKIAFHPTLGYAVTPPVPQKVARRNARERNRVKQVNCGFEMLRAHIPSAAKQKKMSKVDTLRHAVEYIQNLQSMLNEKQNNLPQNNTENYSQQYQPLTPTTPNTPMNTFQASAPESGYDTASSFYSSPGSIHQYPMQNSPSFEYNHYHVQQHQQQTQLPVHPVQQQQTTTFFNSELEPNSEEDELLDVIAKWQDN